MYIVHPNQSHIFCITIGKALDCCWLWPTESFFKWNSLAWVCVVSQYNWVLCNSSEKNVCALPEKKVRANGVLFHIMTRRYSIYIYASATMEFEKVHLLPSKGFYRFLFATKKQCSIPLFRFQRNDCKETCSHTALVQTDKLAMWRLHSEIFSVAISSIEQYSMFQ